jgi:hypothetical protein
MSRSTHHHRPTLAAVLAVAGLLLAVAFPAAATAAPSPPLIRGQGCSSDLLISSPDRWLISYCYSGTVTPAGEIVARSDGNVNTFFGSPPPSSAVRVPLDRSGCDLLTNHFFGHLTARGGVTDVQGLVVITPSGNTHVECTGTFIPFGS